MPKYFQRKLVADLSRAVTQLPHLMHVVLGPRQVGKMRFCVAIPRPRAKGFVIGTGGMALEQFLTDDVSQVLA